MWKVNICLFWNRPRAYLICIVQSYASKKKLQNGECSDVLINLMNDKLPLIPCSIHVTLLSPLIDSFKNYIQPNWKQKEKDKSIKWKLQFVEKREVCWGFVRT